MVAKSLRLDKQESFESRYVWLLVIVPNAMLFSTAMKHILRLVHMRC